jgi:hypothetical protein
MSAAETPLEEAERHIREYEARITRQEALVGEMERHGHAQAAARARDLLKTFRETLRVAQDHRRRLIEERGRP